MSTPPMIHRISVKRRTDTGSNSLGERTYSEVEVFSSVRARVETFTPKIDYTEPGQRPVKEIIVYTTPEIVLQSQDIVIAETVAGYATNSVIGIVNEVVVAVKGYNNDVNHYESRLEINPTGSELSGA